MDRFPADRIDTTMHALLIAASPTERSRSAALLDAADAALQRAGVSAESIAAL